MSRAIASILSSDPAATQPDRPSVARTVATARRAEREDRIIRLFNEGVSVAEIAAQEGVSLKRMRNCLREILARRQPRPPAEFIARQVGQLNEALLLSFDAMVDPETGANFAAIDRVVSIVRQLDRFNGFSAPAARSRAKSRRPPPSQEPLAPAPVFERLAKHGATD